MQEELDKTDLINLASSVGPYYTLFNHPLVSKLGEWQAGRDVLYWDKHMLKELTEQELYDLYQLCKSSWK